MSALVLDRSQFGLERRELIPVGDDIVTNLRRCVFQSNDLIYRLGLREVGDNPPAIPTARVMIRHCFYDPHIPQLVITPILRLRTPGNNTVYP